MEDYNKRFARNLAETGALFFDKGLVLKDGRPTPYFVNLGMFRSGRQSMEMGSYFADMLVHEDLVKMTDIILGPSYKGSAIAVAAALSLYVNHGHDLLFDYDRKEAKTHGEGSSTASLFVNKTFYDGCRVFIVDDVATSMGTKYDLIERIAAEGQAKEIKIHIIGIGIAIDREQTTAMYDAAGKVLEGIKGENAIQKFVGETGIPVYRVAGIRQVIQYLYQKAIPVMIEGARRPIDDGVKAQFDEYWETYGTG
jgi:orotate phosphoribosyltransferase